MSFSATEGEFHFATAETTFGDGKRKIKIFQFFPPRQKSAEVFLLEWPLSYWNAPQVCQDVHKYVNMVTRGYVKM